MNPLPVGQILGPWAEQISQWLPKGGQNLTVVSQDGQWLKVLHATGGWHARTITTLLAHPVQGLSDWEILSWLQQAYQAGPFEPGSVLVANPAHLTTARVFVLPSANPVEIRDIVGLQAEKHTPYAKEEVLTDFTIIDTDRDGYSRVMLIISHQDVVHRALRVVDGMQWPLERVGFELEGLLNWFGRVRGGSSKETVLLAEMDSETTTLVIVRQGRPYFHRSLALGVTQLSADLAGAPARFIGELQRSLEAFETENLNMPLSELVLTGQVERFPELHAQVQQGLNLPTTVISPFEGCPLSDRAVAAKATLPQVSFVSLMGLVMAKSQIDLTPKTQKLHRVFEMRVRALVGLGCQLILGLMLLSVLAIGKAQQRERYHVWLAKEYQRAAKEAEELGFALKQLELVRGWLNARGEYLEALMELSRYTPPAIEWESFTFKKGELVLLKGTSRELPKVFDLVAALEQSPRFARVEAGRVAKRKEKDQDVTDFEITCQLVTSREDTTVIDEAAGT